MGAIRKAEQARFAYLLNVLVSSPPPPPTRPVDCMNYSSICNKQLGNYYCHNQINNSPCDVATTWQNLLTYPKENKGEFMDLVLLGWAELVFFFSSSGATLSLFLSLLFSCLSLLQPSSFLPLSCPSQGHSWKESCDGGESAGLPARLPCDHSPLLCVSLSFAALSFWSGLGGDKFTPSVWLDLYIVCVWVCVCVEV